MLYEMRILVCDDAIETTVVEVSEPFIELFDATKKNTENYNEFYNEYFENNNDFNEKLTQDIN